MWGEKKKKGFERLRVATQVERQTDGRFWDISEGWTCLRDQNTTKNAVPRGTAFLVVFLSVKNEPHQERKHRLFQSPKLPPKLPPRMNRAGLKE